MTFSRLFLTAAGAAAMFLALGSNVASACPDRGGGEVAVDVDDQIESLLLSAREAERTAIREDSKAKSARVMASQQRELAAQLRERARNFPELDGEILLAKAVVADREAKAADARAKAAASRAKAQRARAIELRSLARSLAGGGASRKVI